MKRGKRKEKENEGRIEGEKKGEVMVKERKVMERMN